jgi:hypothetical protein
MSTSLFAQTINDELNDQVEENALTIDLQFEEIASCDALNDRITQWIADYKDIRQNRRYPIMYAEDVMLESTAVADGMG